jgi:hypothetical protein
VGRLSRVLEAGPYDPEEVLVENGPVEAVDHHRAVDAREHAALEELDLAAPALFGGRADHVDPTRGETGLEGRQRRARPRARCRDDVVPARVSDAGKRVVLAHDRDGGPVPAAVHGRPERGRDTSDSALDLEPLGLEERGEPA